MTHRQRRASFSIFAPPSADPEPTAMGDSNCDAIVSHGTFIASFPWHLSPLGPQESWSQTFKAQFEMILASSFPTLLCYGPECVLLYNSEFARVVGADNDLMFGRPFNDVWLEAELDLEISEALANCHRTGTPATKTNHLYFVSQKLNDGKILKKESYLNWTLVPVPAEYDDNTTVLVTVTDNTDAVLFERRMQVLKELYDATASADAPPKFYIQSVNVLRKHCSEDIALFGLYVIESVSSKVLRYQGGFGLGGNPDRIEFHTHPALFEQAILDTSSSAVYITTSTDAFRDYIEYDPTRGWSDEVRELIFLPVMRNNETVVGVAVIGLNPRRSFDEPYELFLELLGRQLANGIDNLRHIEETSDKLSWEVASSIRQKEELEERLLEKTKQLRISEGRFSKMAHILPAGLFLASPEGDIVYANDAWYRISSHPRDLNPSFWIKSVHPGDRAMVRDSWRRVMQGQEERIEFRWVRQRSDPANIERWCASAVSAEFDPETGKIANITGIWTDITERKQSEALQRQRADEAVERRRQQEYFIDAISHEMRNPLSAIIQSVEVVSGKVNSLVTMVREIAERLPPDQIDKPLSELTESAECLDTIQLCTSHMRRIIADTINLSKMESGLFPINPVYCKPVSVVNEVLKMYENELKSLSITSGVEVGEAYKQLVPDTVKMDPRRVAQVLINLISNAMKVLASCDRKTILVKLDASLTKPTIRFQNNSSFYYQQTRTSNAGFENLVSTSPSKSSHNASLPTSFSTSALNHIASHHHNQQQQQQQQQQQYHQLTPLGGRSASISGHSASAAASIAGPGTSHSTALNSGKLHKATSYAALAAALSESPIGLSLSTGVESEDKNSIFITFVVKDSGCGMDHEQLATAFQRFTSHFAPRTHVNYGGSGLGLYICRKLVENQGGEITADSKMNEGSEFIFYIKASRSSGSESSSVISSAAPSQPPSPKFSKPSLTSRDRTAATHTQKVILIVEDNLINQKLLQRQLQSHGFATLIANHGQEAIDVILSGERPDCCIMDCEMPIMDGVKAVEKIRELENLGQIRFRLPIIALSANARQVHFDRMFAAGSDRYVTKPFNFAHLIQVVNELITDNQ
ncbi:hypothetical protein V1514DRAFT_8541 [Lipomyces japonicus]|uniref:uncharacterized protein n=1 Tax=Lipomyces japonicus TaxID=56871 RepID=UPI0034D01C8F